MRHSTVRLSISLHHQHDCDIQLIDVDHDGKFGNDPQPWIAEYSSFLQSNGVESDRIRVIRNEKDLRPVDVLCNLDGFGSAYRIKNLGKIYDRCLHSDSRVFMDIKKGSGAFPFLKAYGTNEKLSTREEDGKSVTRVVATPKPPEGGDDAAWDDIAKRLAGEDGFYRPGPEGHSFLFMPRSDDTLVVTFDNLDITMNKRDDRRPWGYSFIKEQGWSMLGVLAGGWTWYRNPWVSEQFDELRDSGFFNRFKRVVFYGASMGGYAACAFSAAAPGADVVAISPQTTLDKSIVPWETRYKVAWDRDFSGAYGDAAQASAAANKVYILYDPYEPLDSGHVARFENDNIERLRAPLLGHRLGSSLNQMGILSPIILGALSGTLTSQDYYQMLRTRKTFPRYQRELFSRAVDKGHKQLAKSLGEYILARNDNRKVRLGLQGL
jgi:pimeloyl-ACP methyl ester carboxylesterase